MSARGSAEPAGRWEKRAACAGMDPAIFFPAPGRGTYRQARAICGRCPVRDECLESTLRAEQSVAGIRRGMFGGLTPAERDALETTRVCAPTVMLTAAEVAAGWKVLERSWAQWQAQRDRVRFDAAAKRAETIGECEEAA